MSHHLRWSPTPQWKELVEASAQLLAEYHPPKQPCHIKQFRLFRVLHKAGYSLIAISTLFGIPRRTVNRYAAINRDAALIRRLIRGESPTALETEYVTRQRASSQASPSPMPVATPGSNDNRYVAPSTTSDPSPLSDGIDVAGRGPNTSS